MNRFTFQFTPESMRWISLGVGIVTISGFLGYRIGVYTRYSRRSSASFWSGSRKLADAGTCLSDDELRGPGRNPVEERESEFYMVLARNQLEEKWRKLMLVFPRTEVGHSLAQATTLDDFSSAQHTSEGKIVAEALKLIESNPHESLNMIRDGLERLGTEMILERQFLVQLAGKLDVDLSSKIDFIALTPGITADCPA